MSLPLRIALSRLTRPTRHRYGTDPSQVADLHLPAGPGPHPVAVVLHGGYWMSRYGKLITRPLARDLASRGWAAWNLEYRRLGIGGGWPMTFQDVAAGIDALTARPEPLDLSRVVLVGHSAGGQLALWAGARGSLPPGAVGADPVVRATAVLALAPVTHLARAGERAQLLMGGTPAQEPVRWAQADPSRAGAPPVPALVLHPTADATVPVARSREFCAATGVPLLETPGGHSDPTDPGSADWAAALPWLDRQRLPG